MSDTESSDTFDKAIDIAEKAIEEAVAGNDEEAERLAEAAKKLDPDAVQLVADDLAERAGHADPAEDLGIDADKT